MLVERRKEGERGDGWREVGRNREREGERGGGGGGGGERVNRAKEERQDSKERKNNQLLARRVCFRGRGSMSINHNFTPYQTHLA